MLDLLFIVMNVSRPLISVGQLNKDGFMVDFGKKSTIRQGGVALPVVGHNGLFYLVATPETMTTSLLRTTLHAQRELLLTLSENYYYYLGRRHDNNDYYYYYSCPSADNPSTSSGVVLRAG